MNKVPLNELKKNLSYWAEEAAKGKVIQVTKYNRPYILMMKGPQTGLTVGVRFGKALTSSPLRNASKGKWLQYLLEDRRDD